MWATWNLRAGHDEKLAETTRSLLEDTLERLIYGSAVALLIWFFVTGQLEAELLLWKFWVVFLTAVLVVRLSIWLIARRLIAAAVCWMAGLFLVNTLFALLLERSEAVFFYTLLPLQAVILLGWQAAAVSTGAVGLALLGIHLTTASVYPPGYLAVVIVSCILSAFLGWISSGALLNEVRNSVYFSRLAQRNLEEAREHRGQMFKVLKDLDLAYYRLERANAALVAAWKEAETAEKFKAEFVTYVSHEMRTPLNLILGFSEAILTTPESYGSQILPGPYRIDINKIHQNAGHLLALVEDVIDLSRANVNRIPLTRERVDIHGLVHEAVEMVRDYIETKGLELSVDLDQHLDILSIDRLRIRQVLLNLLVNAARFTNHGSIRVEGSLQDGRALFKVSDTGKGIEAHEIEHIFDDYHTSGQQDAAWHAGTGLGLPISRKLIQLHGGQMGVTSERQQGSTFWFNLPLENDFELRNERATIAPFSALPYQTDERERILILAHEDPGAGRILQRATRGLRVQQVETWAQALELARQVRAQAVVCAGEKPLDIPADLVAIQYPLPGTRLLAEKLGVAEVLEKPVLQNDLLEAIRRLTPEARSILVVDDEPEVTEMFQRMLAPRFEPGGVRVANDARAALTVIESQAPDLLILDLVMPEMDGYALIDHLHRSGGPAFPILVISGTVGDIYSEHIQAPMSLERPGGLRLGEAIQTIEAVVRALSPGWE
jgi:signal transduction histidine kinase/CheY-like chemotaxis protein